MTTASIKSANGRTEWLLVDGRLKEIGPDSFTFTLTTEDTYRLFSLLCNGQQDILSAHQKERGTQEDVSIKSLL
jgi:hypothetical protein